MDEATAEKLVEESKHLLECFEKMYGANPVETLVKFYRHDHQEHSRQGYLRLLINRSKEMWWAYDALHCIAKELRREGKLPPVELIDWLICRGPCPTRKPDTVFIRNRHIISVVQWLCIFKGIQPTRNRERQGESIRTNTCCFQGGSSCDIVGMAAGISGYKTIEKIWMKRALHASSKHIQGEAAITHHHVYLSPKPETFGPPLLAFPVLSLLGINLDPHDSTSYRNRKTKRTRPSKK